MGLKFSKLEPIEFGDISAEPVMGAELRLRIQNTHFETPEQIEESKGVILQAFPTNTIAIKQFMDEQMSIIDLQRLQAYLSGGQVMLDMVDDRMNAVLQDVTVEAIKKEGKNGEQ